MLILFVLLAALMLTPLMLGGFSEPGEEAPVEMILLFVGTVSMTGGFLAGTNNGVQKADISAGWKRYSFVLPPTAKQQALSDLLVKLMLILLFGLLSAAFAMIYSVTANYNAFGLMLNIYLGAVCAVMLIDVAYSYIIMFAKTKKDLAVIGVAAFLGAGLIIKIVDLFLSGTNLLSDNNLAEHPAEDGALISDAAFNRFVTALSSGKTTLCIVIAFAVLCALFFLVMWRSHERREP
ncbi:hypothetical protein [Ruminococcus flavefaciens]|uniref:hypothetical protein n=1 Tax=Ruminococcus flavefaciens TaxID=1265 RepID=UPI0015668425|nr:hypothetical protein [Ruminococcus flavefaciens]